MQKFETKDASDSIRYVIIELDIKSVFEEKMYCFTEIQSPQYSADRIKEFKQ